MASNMLEASTSGRPSGAKEEKIAYEYDAYGNLSKKPLRFSRSFRNGGDANGYSSAGYQSDQNQRGYYQKHESPYANPSGRSRHGGDQYNVQPKVESHNWGARKTAKAKEAVGDDEAMNAGGRSHYVSDVSDVEGSLLTDTDMFSSQQAAAEYAPVIQEEARYGLMPTHEAKWNPRFAQGLHVDTVLTWNGSCTQFAEKKAAGLRKGTEYDPTMFHWNKDLAKHDMHAGAEERSRFLHPFERNMIKMNAERGNVQLLKIDILEERNDLDCPVGVVFNGYPPANQVRFGNVKDKFMTVLFPKSHNASGRSIDLRPLLNADDMQLAATVQNPHIRGSILGAPGDARVAVAKNSLLFDCIVGYSKNGKIDIPWEETGEFKQSGAMYVSNLPRDSVELCVDEIGKRIRRKTSNISLNNLHFSIHPLNAGGNFLDHKGTPNEWLAKNNKELLDEKLHSPGSISIKARMYYV